MSSVEIEPASVVQFQKALGGTGFIEISDDVGSIAKNLRDIDSRLHLRMNLETNTYVVYAVEGDSEYLVSTYKELDQRVVKAAEKYASDRYDYLAEMDRIDKEADRAKKRDEENFFGEMGEVLGHAVRKDMHRDKGRISLNGTDSTKSDR